MKWSPAELTNFIKNADKKKEHLAINTVMPDTGETDDSLETATPETYSSDNCGTHSPDQSYTQHHAEIAKSRTNSTHVRDRNVANVDNCICAAGSAISALDTIETKLQETRDYIASLAASHQPINDVRAHEFILMFAREVNNLISELDSEGLNLLRDNRVQIRFVELSRHVPESNVELALISIEKLVAYKIQKSDGTPHEWVAFFDTLSNIVKSNIQIISSVMLALIASRDYVNAVSDYAFRENVFGAKQVPPSSAPIANQANQQTAPLFRSNGSRNEFSPKKVAPLGKAESLGERLDTLRMKYEV